MKQCDILFIHPPYQRRKDSGVYIPLGLAYLASFLRLKGLKPIIFDCAPYFQSTDQQSLLKLEVFLLRKLKVIKPNLAIGIGPCTLASVPSLPVIEDVCNKLFPNTPIIYGGPLASIPGLEWFFFEYLHAFAVIPGDAEIVLFNLLSAIRNKENIYIDGVYYDPDRRFVPNIIENLDELPFPARDLFEPNLYYPSIRRNLFIFPFTNMICSRGCLFNCGFCASSTMRKGIQTKRSLENISEEIRTLKAMGIKSIIFFDDTFFSNGSTINEEISDFSKIIYRISPNMFWQIEMRPDVACLLEKTTIKTMYRAGCRQVNLGIEKGTEKGLKSIGKSLRPEHSVEACKRIREATPKLRLAGTFIIGGPQETYDEAIETIEFSTNLGLLFAHFYPLEIYPGTRLYQQKCGSDMAVWLEKILSESTFRGSFIYEDVLSKKDLIELIIKAYRKFYRRKEWTILARKYLGSKFDFVNSIVFSWGERIRQ
jgi:radical SAM superfamily enzyme YgiQ (UPF0313 family)